MMYKILFFLLLLPNIFANTLILYDTRSGVEFSINDFISLFEESNINYNVQYIEDYKKDSLFYFESLFVFNNEGIINEELIYDIDKYEKNIFYFGREFFSYVNYKKYEIPFDGYGDSFLFRGENYGRLPLIRGTHKYFGSNGKERTPIVYIKDNIYYYSRYNSFSYRELQKEMFWFDNKEEFYYFLNPKETYEKSIVNYLYEENLIFKVTEKTTGFIKTKVIFDEDTKGTGVSLNSFESLDEFIYFHNQYIEDLSYSLNDHRLTWKNLSSGKKLSIIFILLLGIVIVSFSIMLYKSNKIMKKRYSKGDDRSGNS